MKKVILSLVSAALATIATSCATNNEVPGEINVESRTIDRDPKPGNILAEGRITSIDG